MDDLIRKYADHWNLAPHDTTAHLCSHYSMVDNVKGILHRRGWQEGSIRE